MNTQMTQAQEAKLQSKAESILESEKDELTSRYTMVASFGVEGLKLYGLCVKFARNYSFDLEDVCGQAIELAYKNMEVYGFVHFKSIKRALFNEFLTTSKYMFINMYYTRKHNLSMVDHVNQDGEDFLETLATTEDQELGLSEKMEAAFQSMKPRDQKVAYLLMHDYKPSEIAKMLNISPTLVTYSKRRIAKALA